MSIESHQVHLTVSPPKERNHSGHECDPPCDAMRFHARAKAAEEDAARLAESIRRYLTTGRRRGMTEILDLHDERVKP